MNKYIIAIIFFIQSMSVLAQNTPLNNKDTAKRQQDSIYFYNVLDDNSISQQYYVSINVKSLTYNGRVIMGASSFISIISRFMIPYPQDSAYLFALQILLNEDTLHIESVALDFEHEPYKKLKMIPIIEEYASKGQD